MKCVTAQSVEIDVNGGRNLRAKKNKQKIKRNTRKKLHESQKKWQIYQPKIGERITLLTVITIPSTFWEDLKICRFGSAAFGRS